MNNGKKFLNAWNLPLLVLVVTMILTAVAVLAIFVMRLAGLTTFDVINATIPLGVVVLLVLVWSIGLFIYSKATNKSFLESYDTDFTTDTDSDDGWE